MPDKEEILETDNELLARWRSVKADYDRVKRAMERLPLGSARRARKAMRGGCLSFTLGMIQSELRARGLDVPTVG